MDIMTEIFPLIGLLLCLGAFTGFLAGLLGVGGGIILVPGLYYVLSYLQPNMGFDPAYLMHISVGTSLAIIVPTGLSSAFAHHKRGSVDFDLVKNIGGGIIIGVIFAIWIARGLDVSTMKIIFASVLLILALIMMINPSRLQSFSAEPKQPFSSLAGIVIGSVSTLIGIGGATLSVPYMSFYGVSIHRSVGTASALGLVISIPAALGFMVIGAGLDNLPPYSLGYVNLIACACVIPASIFFAPLGARAAHKISVQKLNTIFAVFTIIVALNMWRQILIAG